AFEGSDYRLQRIVSPQTVPSAQVSAELARLRKLYLKENVRLVKETPIVVDGVIGEDLAYTISSAQGGVAGRTRHFIACHSYYALTVTSSPGKPLREAAEHFLSSLTFEALVKARYAEMNILPKSAARPPTTAPKAATQTRRKRP